MFTHTGNVIVEKKNDLEQAIEDAINVDAKDVEEFKENDKEYFRVCNKNIYVIFNLYQSFFPILKLQFFFLIYIFTWCSHVTFYSSNVIRSL